MKSIDKQFTRLKALNPSHPALKHETTIRALHAASIEDADIILEAATRINNEQAIPLDRPEAMIIETPDDDTVSIFFHEDADGDRDAMHFSRATLPERAHYILDFNGTVLFDTEDRSLVTELLEYRAAKESEERMDRATERMKKEFPQELVTGILVRQTQDATAITLAFKDGSISEIPITFRTKDSIAPFLKIITNFPEVPILIDTRVKALCNTHPDTPWADLTYLVPIDEFEDATRELCWDFVAEEPPDTYDEECCCPNCEAERSVLDILFDRMNGG